MGDFHLVLETEVWKNSGFKSSSLIWLKIKFPIAARPAADSISRLPQSAAWRLVHSDISVSDERIRAWATSCKVSKSL